MSERESSIAVPAAAVFVWWTMFVYGLAESWATHRVAVSFDAMCVLRVFAVASTYAVVALAVGRVCRLVGEGPKASHIRWLVLILAVIGGIGYVLDGGHVAVAVVATLAALVVWWVGRSGSHARWIAWLLPITWLLLPLGAQTSPSLSVWLLLAAACVGVPLVAHDRWPQQHRGSHIGLWALATLTGALAPWPYATVYASLMVFIVAVCAFAGASLVWASLREVRSARLARTMVGIPVAGAIVWIGLLASGREVAYGPYPVNSMVGAVTLVVYPSVDAVERERERRVRHPREALACPPERYPGVVWIVADTVRADAVDGERWFDGLDVVEFGKAYAPGTSTAMAFGRWFDRHPRDCGAALKFVSAVHDDLRLSKVLATTDADVELRQAPCADEGAALADALDFTEGTVNFVYLPGAHEPYRCDGSAGSYRECYAAAVECTREQVLPIMHAARERGWPVVFTSDHGESLGEKALRFHATALWEEQVRVPLYISAPGWGPGRVDVPVSNAWIPPTIACWVGHDPAIFAEATGLLVRDQVPQPLALHGYALNRGRSQSWAWSVKREDGVVDWPSKLIVDIDTQFEVLFDLEADPYEENNLAPERPSEVAALREVLDATWGPALDEPFASSCPPQP